MILIFLNNLQNQNNQSKKKALTLKTPIILLDGRQKVLNAFESGIFQKEKKNKENDLQVF